MDLLTLAASTYSALQDKKVRKTVGALATKARRTVAAAAVRMRHVPAPRRDTYTPGKPTRDDRTLAQQQAFLKSSRVPGNARLQSAGFRDKDHYESNLKAARRMLGQERGMRSEGEASTHGDTRELNEKMRAALELEAQNKLTEQQHNAQEARQRRQGLNSTVEGQQSRYTAGQYAKDALVQTPAFLRGMAVGYAKAGVEFAGGLVQAARHPIQTGTAVANAVAHPLETAGAAARWGNEQSLKMDEALKRGDVYGFGKAYGHTSGTIVVNAVGPKVVSRALKFASSTVGPLAAAAATRFPALAPAIALANRAAVASGNVLRAAANSKPGQVATRAWEVANQPLALPKAIPAAVARVAAKGKALVAKIAAPAASLVHRVSRMPGKLWNVAANTRVGKAISRVRDAVTGKIDNTAQGAEAAGAPAPKTRERTSTRDAEKAALKRGEVRSERFSGKWPEASLRQTIKNVAGENPTITTEGSKTVYTNSLTGKQVVYDRGGNYFRVRDPNLKTRRQFLDENGNLISANKTETLPNGRTRQTGKSYDEYMRETHFRNGDR